MYLKMLQWLPLIAIFANITVFLAMLREKDSYGRFFQFLLICLIGGNASLYLMFTGADEHQTSLGFLIFRHFIFLVPPTLVTLSRILSGRDWKSPLIYGLYAVAILLILLVDWDFMQDSSILISEYRKTSWGVFPTLSLLARILVGGFFAVSALSSLFFLLRPTKEKVDTREIPFLVFCWWIGFTTNFLPLLGLNILPLGMVIDAIVCVFLSAYVQRPSALSNVHRLSETFAVLGVGIGIGIVVSGIFNADKSSAVLFVGFGVILTILTLSKVFRKLRKDAELSVLNKGPLDQLGMTKQEIRICELIMEGYSRNQIAFFLGITDGTLRNHLAHLYEKTVDKEKSSDSRDKLQRLTVYLKKFENRDIIHT